MKRPAWLAAVVILALVFLPMAVWLDLKHLSNDALTRQAVDLNKMITEIRGYYARNVVGRILNNQGRSTPTHNYKEVAGGIPIPATLSIELGNLLGKKQSKIGYSFLSDYVFTNRESRELTPFETSAIKQFRESKNPDDRLIKITGNLLRRQINMAVPVIMGKSCVACHNSHPLSPKKDWKVGDVRGIQSIRVEQPIAANIFSFKYLLIYLLLASTIGFSFVVLQWRQAVQYARLNTDLEEANSFLASVSMKISKYLSPQVYKSIFRGERDVVISTERKKLTIFFSDIKDFTATSERLQPEELTSLLNEYFTEMEKIAHEHGATVDKFIGDAILAFFGDPETKGAHQDAQECVKMAIAMQQRMVSLNQEWRQRGIEKPFLVRMGINTGYCNVGNFGSTDRMDYTIIGAEANLAARLESIASPGGIVISFETYSLVQNIIHAKQMNEISLKGISRKIIPYEIANIYGTATNQSTDVLNQNTDRLNLKIDLTDIRGAERYEIENALKLALAKVSNQAQKN
ncbi:MAG: adenylate/guanylate cyclase domain-containing protein [Gammaproteobacteria bacterium]|nr:adenylate/guanylate cyclase domain-containing protein [Gammaproteobacteria bacterium]